MGNQIVSSDKMSDNTSSLTSLEFDEFKHTWIIKHFGCSTEATGDWIESEPFVGGREKTTWQLDIFPKGDCAANKQFVSVWLLSLNELPTRARIRMTISNSKHGELGKLDQSEWLNVKFEEPFYWGQALDRAIPLPADDKLVVTLELTIVGDRHYPSKMTNEAAILTARQRSRESLAEDFKMALRNEHGIADVVIYAGSALSAQRELHAHKMVLSTRSPVFKHMLSGNTLERKNKAIILEDTAVLVMEGLLQYMYTGTTSALPTLTTDLFAIADKYEVLGLKQECSALIVSGLTAENACASLILADTHNDAKLKDATIAYINANAVAVRATAGFNELLQADKRLLGELVSATLGRGVEKPAEPAPKHRPP